MTNNDIKLFKRFLKERGVYGKFMYYTFSPKIEKCAFFKQRRCNLNFYLREIRPSRVLLELFFWDDYGFWSKKSGEWIFHYESCTNK